MNEITVTFSLKLMIQNVFFMNISGKQRNLSLLNGPKNLKKR
jgi:hypothetical protein